jgi:hypothetical protein
MNTEFCQRFGGFKHRRYFVCATKTSGNDRHGHLSEVVKNYWEEYLVRRSWRTRRSDFGDDTALSDFMKLKGKALLLLIVEDVKALHKWMNPYTTSKTRQR